MLKVNGLTKIFGGLRAVDNASLEVGAGQIVSLIGPNGAGKTTLFASIAGFHKIDQGQVELLGQNIVGLAVHEIARRGMVRTFQITQPFAKLTVLENIAVGAFQQYADKNQAHHHARLIAEKVGMSGILDQPASELTVAGRKRLELARALATGPKLLLLDEVMAGLNPQEIVEIIDLIRSIRDSGVTILLIEHVMHAVMSLSEYIYVLSYGKVIAHGKPQEVVRNREVIEAYLGRGAADQMSDQADGQVDGQAQGAAHA